MKYIFFIFYFAFLPRTISIATINNMLSIVQSIDFKICMHIWININDFMKLISVVPNLKKKMLKQNDFYNQYQDTYQIH